MDFERLATFARSLGNRDFDRFFAEYLRMSNIRQNDPTEFENARKSAMSLFKGYKSNDGFSEKDWGTGSRGDYIQIGNRNIGAGATSFLFDALKAQQRQGTRGPEFDSLQKMIGIFADQGGIKNPAGWWKQLGIILKDEVLIYLQQQTKLYETINESAQMTGQLAADYRQELMKVSPELTRLGIRFDDMADSVAKLLQDSGKFKLLNDETITQMGLASKFIGDMKDLAGMAKSFEDVGYGVRDMTKLVEQMGFSSLRIGLNARNTIELVNKHLGELNRYGFKEGVEGLTKMGQKSIEFRMNMSEVLKLADRVWEPDKALELVANLQVIGGAFGDLNDPIKLMYMATNNVEGLQDALIGAAKSLTTYNNEQGRFQITGANLRRAKAMAEELGVTYEELSKGAIAAAERTRAASDLMISGLVMKEDDKEFLTNLAQMKEGRMVIELPGTLKEKFEADEIALEELNQTQLQEILTRKKEFEKIDSMEDIARRQVTAVENIERDLSFVRAMVRVNAGAHFGTLLEKIGITQDNLSGESKKISEYVAKQIKTSDVMISEMMKQLPEFGELIKEEARIKAESKPKIYETPERREPTEFTPTRSAEPTTSNVKIDFEFKSDTVTDEFRRLIMRDTTILEETKEKFKKSYIESPI